MAAVSHMMCRCGHAAGAGGHAAHAAVAAAERRRAGHHRRSGRRLARPCHAGPHSRSPGLGTLLKQPAGDWGKAGVHSTCTALLSSVSETRLWVRQDGEEAMSGVVSPATSPAPPGSGSMAVLCDMMLFHVHLARRAGQGWGAPAPQAR